jgi:hypothetical protein
LKTVLSNDLVVVVLFRFRVIFAQQQFMKRYDSVDFVVNLQPRSVIIGQRCCLFVKFSL